MVWESPSVPGVEHQRCPGEFDAPLGISTNCKQLKPRELSSCSARGGGPLFTSEYPQLSCG
eukprot:2166921-Pyramimonas_sp.AAC.1